MAQGQLLTFYEFKKNVGGKLHDLSNDVFKIAFITTLPTRTDVSPTLGDYTEVSGTNYTAGGETLTMTWVGDGTTTDWSHAGGTITWVTHPSGPTNIIAGLIYNATAAGNPAVAFVDMTGDGGTTPISLADGPITWTPDVSNIIFRLTV